MGCKRSRTLQLPEVCVSSDKHAQGCEMHGIRCGREVLASLDPRSPALPGGLALPAWVSKFCCGNLYFVNWSTKRWRGHGFC